MPNRLYTDLNKLRRDTNDLIDQGRVRVHQHAKKQHSEFSDFERIQVVRLGGTIQFDQTTPQTSGRYVCWSFLSPHGLCRAVFVIEEHPGGDLVLIISVFSD